MHAGGIHCPSASSLGRPFAERFALCYWTVFCLSVCPVSDVGVLWQTVGWIKMKPGMQVGLGPDHNVLDGDPAPPSPKWHSPQFSVHICGGQMAGWIKMPLGREVGLGQSDIVLNGYPALSPLKGGRAPNFRPMSIVTKRQDGSRCHLAWR